MKFNYIFLIIVLVSSCNENAYVGSAEKIKVQIKENYSQGDFNDYFSDSRVVALESNDHSFFSKIDRLWLYKDTLYILDRKLNSVYIFDDSGKFINKIEQLGQGPGEYISLNDFAIDTDKGRIIVYSDRPHKFLLFDLAGNFIEERKEDDLLFNIGYFDGKVLGLVKGERELLREYDLGSNEKRELISSEDIDRFYKNYGVRTPQITSGKNTHLTLPYSSLIYEYQKDQMLPKYEIDFGDHAPPKDLFKNKKNMGEIFQEVQNRGYGFEISNFRETEEYAFFNFRDNMITIYDKDRKEANSYSDFVDIQRPFFFYNYFAHDGDDDKLISVHEAFNFKRQLDVYREDKDTWQKLPPDIFNIAGYLG